MSTFIGRYRFQVKPLTIGLGQLDLLKVLAFASMLSDHVNKALLHGAYPAMELFGRFAFPLFAWCFAYSFVHHLRNEKRFVLTCLVFALVSQWPFYQVLVQHAPGQVRLGSLNILASFLLAYVINRLPRWSYLAQPAAYFLFLVGGLLCFDASYAWGGIGLILCCVGFFRTGGVLYAAGCLVLLLVCLAPDVPNVAMFVPIVTVVMLLSCVSVIGARMPRFLPRNWLYIGYTGHLWLLYLISSRFHW